MIGGFLLRYRNGKEIYETIIYITADEGKIG